MQESYKRKYYFFIISAHLVIFFNSNLIAQADSSYLSNVTIDVIEHNKAVWLTSGEGLSFSNNDGLNWLSIVEGNGLVSSNISAIFSIPTTFGQRLWIGSNHTERINDINISISDGISYSNDNGSTWTQIDFGPDGLDIPYIWGGSRTVFDITGHYDINNPEFDDWLFFTSFAGGLLASRDGGLNWRRIYGSVSDSIQYNDVYQVPSFRNRYFSCATDTSHSDSIYIWAGTAEGIFSFRYSEPKDKLSSEIINNFEISNINEFVYIGGYSAFMRGVKSGSTFISRFTEDGLPGGNITAIKEFGDRLFIGIINNETETPQLAISDDLGNSFSPVNIPQINSKNSAINNFAIINDRIYMSAGHAGLFVSSDSGNNWSHIFVDSSDVTQSNLRNNINTASAKGDTLLVGTDSGLVHLFMDANGSIDSSRFFVFLEDVTSSTKVVTIKVQNYQGVDVLWTINEPLTASGTSFVGRSFDDGLNFLHYQIGVNSYDIDFINDTTFIIGENGILSSIDDTDPSINVEIIEYSDDVAIESLNSDLIITMEIKGDTIYIGSDNGLAVSTDRGLTYDIVRVNTDSLNADDVRYYNSDTPGILSDWFPAMGVQYTDQSTARIWASSRPSILGSNAISVYNNGDWINVYDDFAWNFAFNGDTVFAATNSGLIWTSSDSLMNNPYYRWDTLEFIDENGEQVILSGAQIFGIEIIGENLWIGTSDRTVKINLNNLSNQTPYFVVDDKTSSDEIYAFPTPFSHSSDLAIDFHFVLEKDASVSIEVYDFAMNLVARIIDNVQFTAGIYPTYGSGRVTWDGRNQKGDNVAIGIYYFKLETSAGVTKWGKLAIIP